MDQTSTATRCDGPPLGCGDTRPRATSTALTLSLGVTGGTLLLNLLTGVLLARTLGPSGRGELTAVLLWPSLLAVLGGLGVSDALTFYAARRWNVDELVGGALVLAAAQSVVLFAIGLLIEPLVLHHYHHGAVVSATIMLAGYVPTSLLALNLFGIINGRQRLVSYQLLRGLVMLITAVGLTALAVAHALTVRNVVFCYVGANVTTMLAAAIEIWRRDRARPLISRVTTRALALFGVKSQTGNVSVALNAQLDQLLVSVFLSPQALGLYTIAATVAWVVSMIGYSVSIVALPVVAGDFDDPMAQRERARSMLTLTVTISTLVAVPLIAFAPTFLDLVFGHAFHHAATAARILIASSIVFSVNRALEAVLRAAGRPLAAGVAEAMGLVVTAASLAVLIQFHGLPGIASASMLAALTSFAILLSRANDALGLSLFDLIPSRSDFVYAISLMRRSRRVQVTQP